MQTSSRAVARPLTAAEQIHAQVYDTVSQHVQGRIYDVPHGHREHGLEHEIARTAQQRENNTVKQLQSALNFLQTVPLSSTPSAAAVTRAANTVNPHLTSLKVNNSLTDTPRSVIEDQMRYADKYDRRQCHSLSPGR